MGWNCNACGHLLKPDKPMTDVAQALWILIDKLFLPKGSPRVCSCSNCGARFLIIEGKQPGLYLNSVMICIDDGEEEKR